MSEPGDAAFTAFHAADRLRSRLAAPWEIFGERIRRFEMHLNGARVEMIRAPIELEGFGLRLFRRADDHTSIGQAAGSSLSDAALSHALSEAEEVSRFSSFPTRRVDLPGTASHPASVEVIDREAWDRPVEAMERISHALVAPLEGRRDVLPSFGSVRLTQFDTTIANSEGLRRKYSHSAFELEFAVRSVAGAQGAAPGEYWVVRRGRRLPTDREIASEVAEWCARSRDVQTAHSPTTGPTRVILPPSVLSDVLPAILGYRLSGPAQLRKMAPSPGTTLGAPTVTVLDDGLLPYGLGTAPCDDEGTTQARRTLIEAGVVRAGLMDLLHAGALTEGVTGNGRRDSTQFPNWFHFATPPSANPTNLVLAPGTGGSEEELLEACGEGLLIDQLGYAFPDPLSGAFGGEIRLAYRVHNGRKGEAIRGGTLGGILFGEAGERSLLGSISAVGRTPELAGPLSTPPVLVEEMTVAGG